ncbi:MAG: phosphogluconate dehydratase, partial [Gammaproteobacteria bacterium]
MNAPLNTTLARVTQRIVERSADLRSQYLASMDAQARAGKTQRAGMGCANMAHTTAALPAADKLVIHAERAPHVGIITAYNDMLSAHQPFRDVPEVLKKSIVRAGGLAQFAGGVPAMCDGI